MFDVGFTELLLLAIIAMVVVGPERLPGLAKTVGKTVGQARRFMGNLQRQIEQEVRLSELNDLNKKILDEEQALKNTITGDHAKEDAEAPSVAPSEYDPDDTKAHQASTGEQAIDEQDDDTQQRS
ncbi:MAG: Sec-independent protein translocase protein TatB [Reinekea sp.]|jgi:sec-independent protein translocase protein TatB